MTLRVSMAESQLKIEDEDGLISGKHQNQLNYWGFEYHSGPKSFLASSQDIYVKLEKLLDYFSRNKLQYSLAQDVTTRRLELASLKSELQKATIQGAAVKDGDIKLHRPKGFVRFLKENIHRKLKDHQIKAALHLLAVENGANFSVPGSGKTTVVLTVFEWLRQHKLVDALFVVGPPSCFGPWCVEYRSVLGIEPKTVVLAGGNIEERRSKYIARKETLCDLYLTSFQTLQRDWERVKRLFENRGLRFYFVVDEAHYIKQIDGRWANAVLNITQHAERRCVLTGTPFPRSFTDAFNLFDVLWPHCPPFSQNDRAKMEFLLQKKRDNEAINMLQRTIGSLFYRVRKKDLGLAPQIFHEPIVVRMGKNERFIYDSILDQLRILSKEDYFRDIDLLIKLRRGRMMRLRQCISYSKLLGSAVTEYNENLLGNNLPLANLIKRYDEFEIPAKLEMLLSFVEKLRKRGEKVLIWSNFVQTLKLISRRLKETGHGVRLIYGETPTQASSLDDEVTREKIIADFIDPSSGIDVLIANPAACAESISLHKTCSYAIYYDLSYNCAQYLQSLDRIHRVGGSENKVAHYYFLQYADTIDADILANVRKKASNMSAIVDQDYPVYSMDMFSTDEELEAYERIFK